ncbi:MAG: pinensin family lanthipeptide [Cyclobacteriaceae bacterium]
MKKERLQLKQLKIESFVTELDDTNQETVQGGGTPGITISIATIMESIHEIGDNYSWWHCDSTGAGNNNISAVVIPVANGEACLLDEVVVS